MAITLDITGVLQAAAFWVSNKGGSNGWKLYLYFYIMLTVISAFVGNDPVILSGTAFLVYYTRVNELNHIAWLMSEFAAANTASMVLFVGNPTNVVICEGFQVNNAGFTGYTILPFLACSLSCFVALAFQFRDSKYLQRKLDVSGDLDVWAVLRDPKGACVGGALLGVCLIVIIVVSFFKVDVWMISLPFAFAKFLWDLGWDKFGNAEWPQNEKSDDGNDEFMERQLRKQKTNTKIKDDLVRGLHQKHANGVANKVVNGTANANVDVVRNTMEPVQISSPPHRTVTFDEGAHSSIPTASTDTRVASRSNTLKTLVSEDGVDSISYNDGPLSPSKTNLVSSLPIPLSISNLQPHFWKYLSTHFPTLYTAIPRLPFALVPFAFSQFILIEALARQGWIQIFAKWLVIVTKREMFKTIWVVGVLGVLLCNTSGTNIGATILLTKIMRQAATTYVAPSSGPTVNIDAFLRSAAIALAVASNIGAVSFTFSASLAGLLWKQILTQKKITVTQTTFARWNVGPVIVMTTVGLAVVSAEMAVLYH
ncbi:hypothetical protein BYT27DRAFT_7336307 [Phlegmacium glaucopus]|nr:hypothetical protein BYT27DRAFT_7336307 [Phlegmacium glaucopus]